MKGTIGAGLAVALLAVSQGAVAAPPSVDEARRALIGQWEGKLEYRDYQADTWFGLPVKVEVRDGGDGVTLIRTADYDDGPKTGVVRITTAAMLADNGMDEASATFRKGREVEMTRARLAVSGASTGRDDWVMTETMIGEDDDRPAIIRYTTTLSGGHLVTLKEVDFSDDNKAEWLTRNRTTLDRRN